MEGIYKIKFYIELDHQSCAHLLHNHIARMKPPSSSTFSFSLIYRSYVVAAPSVARSQL